MKPQIYYFIILFVGLVAQAQAVEKKMITFEMLSELVSSKNENVKAANAVVSASEERVGFLSRSFLPTFSLNGGGESVSFSSAEKGEREFWSLEGRWNLYSGGKDRIEENIRKLSVSTNKVSAIKEYQMELRKSRKIYWELVAIKNLKKDIEDALKENLKNISAAKKRRYAGLTTNSDVVDFELENALLIQRSKEINLEEDLMKTRLSILLALDNHKKLEVIDNFPPHTDHQPLPENSDYESNIDVQLLSLTEKIDNLKSAKAGRWWTPKLDVYSYLGRPSISYNDARALNRQDQWLVGLEISFNLDKGFEDRALSKAFDFESKATRLIAANALRKTKAMNHEMIHDLNLTHDLLHDANKDIKKAQLFFNLTRQEYARGVKNGPDLKEAFNKYYSFKARETTLYRNYYQQKADLLYLTAPSK
jgi:outer membrane protein